MKRALLGGLVLFLSAPCAVFGQAPSSEPQSSEPQSSESQSSEPQWLQKVFKEAHQVEEGEVLRIRHLRGDVRIQATDTDRVQITAIAQYRSDDPRLPSLEWTAGESGGGAGESDGGAGESGGWDLSLEFALLEIADDGAWENRRIDVGLLVPKSLEMHVETTDGVIEVKDFDASLRLRTGKGDIVYKGTGDLTAQTEQGEIRARLLATPPGRVIELTTAVGDMHCVLLDGANFRADVETRGPITTDYSIEIEREAGAALKKGKIDVGEDGAMLKLRSLQGGIRLQGLIVPE